MTTTQTAAINAHHNALIATASARLASDDTPPRGTLRAKPLRRRRLRESHKRRRLFVDARP